MDHKIKEILDCGHHVEMYWSVRMKLYYVTISFRQNEYIGHSASLVSAFNDAQHKWQHDMNLIRGKGTM